MHPVDCNWCQKTVKMIDDANLDKASRSHYMCSDCLIELLPKTLKAEDDNTEDTIPEGDRRHEERFPVYSHAYLMLHRLNQPRFFGAVILDISASGLKIIMNERFETGETMTLSFCGQKIMYKATGKVIRCQLMNPHESFGYEIGIRFIKIQQELR